MQLNSATQQTTKLNPEKRKPTCHHCKNRVTTKTSVFNSKKRENKMTPTKMVPVTTIIVIITVVKQTLTPRTKKPSVMVLPRVRTTEKTGNQELSTHPVRHVVKRSTPHRNVILDPIHQPDRLLGIEDQWNKIKTNNKTHRSTQLKVSRLQRKL